MSHRYIGRSLSFCVKSIARKVVDYDDVQYVISGTRFRTENEFIEVIESYLNNSWLTEDQDACLEIAWRLFRDGKILQPRLAYPQTECGTGIGWSRDVGTGPFPEAEK